MSDKSKLSKTRTVRLSAETDKRIEAVAAQKGKTASDVIRETLEAEFSSHRETAGQWVRRVAGTPQTRKPDSAFNLAYRRRHQQ
jgi:predicted secreted protein